MPTDKKISELDEKLSLDENDEFAIVDSLNATTKKIKKKNMGFGSGTGEDGKSAYEIAVENGFEGTEAQWLESLKGSPGTPGTDGEDGADGQSVMIRVDNGYIQWKLVDATEWTNIVALVDLEGTDGTDGTDGEDGKNIELQNSGTYIQWRVVGDTEWTNLIAVSALKGEKGDTGEGLAEGGALGQVLVKSSDTNFDTSWVDSDDNTEMTITRVDGVITEINWQSGRNAVFNRTDGVLDSVIITCVDGRIITKTINRTDGIMMGVTTTVHLP